MGRSCRCWLPIHLRRGRPCAVHPGRRKSILCALGMHWLRWNGSAYRCDRRCGCLPGVDPWDEERDARSYAGPYPVVAHPPCNKWSPLAYINRKRIPGYEIGDDGGSTRQKPRTEIIDAPTGA